MLLIGGMLVVLPFLSPQSAEPRGTRWAIADGHTAWCFGSRVRVGSGSSYYRVVAEAGLLAASVAILIGTVALFVRRVRNPTWVRDAQLAQNASPLNGPLMPTLGALVVALVFAFGIFLIATDHSIVGWVMICGAATGLAHVWVNVWIRRQPLP